MCETLSRTTNIPVDSLIGVAKYGGGCSPGNQLPNCRAANELGVVFLKTDDAEVRMLIEHTFTEILQSPDAKENVKFVSLAFLKHPDAFVSNAGKNIVSEFEQNPANSVVVDAVNERLAQD